MGAIDEATKLCSYCGKEKSLAAFGMFRGKPKSRCKECMNAIARERWRNKTPAEKAAKHKASKQWKLDNRDRVNELQRARIAEQREDRRRRTAEWRAKNPERRRQYEEDRARNNPGLMRAKWSARRARLANALVGWDRELTSFVEREACELAKRRERLFGTAWHVDHVLPIRGRNVCGLHVWNNFAVVPAAFNLAKMNKTGADYEGRPWL